RGKPRAQRHPRRTCRRGSEALSRGRTGLAHRRTPNEVRRLDGNHLHEDLGLLV
ncbi:uncharacterized protein METZ01_LOCUS176317, partial [marine metagenome]